MPNANKYKFLLAHLFANVKKSYFGVGYVKYNKRM